MMNIYDIWTTRLSYVRVHNNKTLVPTYREVTFDRRQPHTTADAHVRPQGGCEQ